MYIVTTKQMQAAEQAADSAGLSYDQMMENAGQAIAQAIQTEFDVPGAAVLILVGPGNNGGDGLVVARHLAQAGAAVTVYVWKRNVENDHNWALLDDAGVSRIFNADDEDHAQLKQHLHNAAIIVDALLGTGVSRPIQGELARLLGLTRSVVSARCAASPGPLIDPTRPEWADDAGPVVVAVDVPSGLNSDTGAVDPHTLPANLTVTLAAVKRGHILAFGPGVVGRLIVGDIGITADYYPGETMPEMATAATAAQFLPDRPATGHKGTFGAALLVAGSINFSGAAILAGQAATRVGPGLVTMAVPRTIHPIVASRITEATYLPLPDSEGFLTLAAAPRIVEKLGRASALLIGPGLGHTESTTQFLTELLKIQSDAPLPPLILDADALNILARIPEWWSWLPSDSILTPHPGEMARLMDVTVKAVQENRLDAAAEMAATWQQIVILKGAHTVIAAPHGRVMVLPFANSALAKGGTGDVLAGIIVGLRAQGVPPFEAAVAGAYLHGLAGELATEQLDDASVLAGDLVGFLPFALQEIK